jgi:hypothetical protein
MGNREWGVGKRTRLFPFPIPYFPLTLLLFTHVTIRGQRRVKLIISCGHIAVMICQTASSISGVSSVIEAFSGFAVASFCDGTAIA